jgi:hypothetical protein
MVLTIVDADRFPSDHHSVAAIFIVGNLECMYKITNLLQETVKRNHILEYTLSLVGIKLTKKW